MLPSIYLFDVNHLFGELVREFKELLVYLWYLFDLIDLFNAKLRMFLFLVSIEFLRAHPANNEGHICFPLLSKNNIDCKYMLTHGLLSI